MSADTAASRARVASTSAAEGAAVLLAAVEEEEASRPRRASARRAAMRSALLDEEVISFRFFFFLLRKMRKRVELEIKKRFLFSARAESKEQRSKRTLFVALEKKLASSISSQRTMRTSTCAAAGTSGAAAR